MQSKQKGSINCMGESRQLTPGVVSRRYLLEEDESGREKEAGEGREKQHTGLLYSMGCSKAVT